MSLINKSRRFDAEAKRKARVHRPEPFLDPEEIITVEVAKPVKKRKLTVKKVVKKIKTKKKVVKVKKKGKKRKTPK